ncbi:MAG: hypothetical protein ACOYXB_06565 [Bacteroidota bacterium]
MFRTVFVSDNPSACHIVKVRLATLLMKLRASHQRRAAYYLSREETERCEEQSDNESGFNCPECLSGNVYFGHTTDSGWWIPYLLCFILLMSPFPLFRKRCHCFGCGTDFLKKNRVRNAREQHQ